MGQNLQVTKESIKRKINRNYFEFLYVIGRGGFGKVWKVKLKKTNELFALKEMSKVKIIDRRSEISIRSERSLLSKLHHPFIVNMYFAFQDFSNLYLTMDLLTGGDLRYHIARQKKFTEKETKFFISNLLLALEYIHSKSIIHRDIKPENLVLESNGYLRLTDFGVAKKNEIDNSSETSGTPGYMAPEVILVQNHSYPSDFFALGVIVFEFMLGYRPYLGRSRKEIKELIISKQAKISSSDLPSTWSTSVIDFCNGLLQRKPCKRLGFEGISQIKRHEWLEEVDWEALKEKKVEAPFLPSKKKENFDKSYCEGVDEIGEETFERYQEYADSSIFPEVFNGYTYVNIEYLKKFDNSNKQKKDVTNSTANINSTNNNAATTVNSTGNNVNNMNNNIQKIAGGNNEKEEIKEKNDKTEEKNEGNKEKQEENIYENEEKVKKYEVNHRLPNSPSTKNLVPTNIHITSKSTLQRDSSQRQLLDPASKNKENSDKIPNLVNKIIANKSQNISAVLMHGNVKSNTIEHNNSVLCNTGIKPSNTILNQEKHHHYFSQSEKANKSVTKIKGKNNIKILNNNIKGESTLQEELRNILKEKKFPIISPIHLSGGYNSNNKSKNRHMNVKSLTAHTTKSTINTNKKPNNKNVSCDNKISIKGNDLYKTKIFLWIQQNVLNNKNNSNYWISKNQKIIGGNTNNVNNGNKGASGGSHVQGRRTTTINSHRSSNSKLPNSKTKIESKYNSKNNIKIINANNNDKKRCNFSNYINSMIYPTIDIVKNNKKNSNFNTINTKNISISNKGDFETISRVKRVKIKGKKLSLSVIGSTNSKNSNKIMSGIPIKFSNYITGHKLSGSNSVKKMSVPSAQKKQSTVQGSVMYNNEQSTGLKNYKYNPTIEHITSL